MPIAHPRTEAPACPQLPSHDGEPLSARHLRCLLECARVLSASLELPVVLDRLLAQATGVLQAESGSIMLLDSARQQLHVEAACGPRAEEIRGRSQPVGEGVAGWVALHGTPLLIQGPVADERFRALSERPDLRQALCAPLVAEGETIGILSVSNRLTEEPFTPADLELLSALAVHAGLAIRNARLFEETRRQRQVLGQLASRLVNAQEEERQRIAFDLHDGPAQSLFAALRTVETIGRRLGRDHGEVGQELEGAARAIRQTIDDLRSTMAHLRPMVLDDLGLVRALRQYGRQFAERTGLNVAVTRCGKERELPPAVAVTLYRVAREALQNVWKHARAENVAVVLDFEPERVALRVMDDGIGFDVARVTETPDPRHLGLQGIRERVSLLGGDFCLHSEIGQGTTLVVTLAVDPLPGPEEACAAHATVEE